MNQFSIYTIGHMEKEYGQSLTGVVLLPSRVSLKYVQRLSLFIHRLVICLDCKFKSSKLLSLPQTV